MSLSTRGLARPLSLSPHPDASEACPACLTITQYLPGTSKSIMNESSSFAPAALLRPLLPRALRGTAPPWRCQLGTSTAPAMSCGRWMTVSHAIRRARALCPQNEVPFPSAPSPNRQLSSSMTAAADHRCPQLRNTHPDASRVAALSTCSAF